MFGLGKPKITVWELAAIMFQAVIDPASGIARLGHRQGEHFKPRAISEGVVLLPNFCYRIGRRPYA